MRFCILLGLVNAAALAASAQKYSCPDKPPAVPVGTTIVLSDHNFMVKKSGNILACCGQLINKDAVDICIGERSADGSCPIICPGSESKDGTCRPNTTPQCCKIAVSTPTSSSGFFFPSRRRYVMILVLKKKCRPLSVGPHQSLTSTVKRLRLRSGALICTYAWGEGGRGGGVLGLRCDPGLRGSGDWLVYSSFFICRIGSHESRESHLLLVHPYSTVVHKKVPI